MRDFVDPVCVSSIKRRCHRASGLRAAATRRGCHPCWLFSPPPPPPPVDDESVGQALGRVPTDRSASTRESPAVIGLEDSFAAASCGDRCEKKKKSTARFSPRRISHSRDCVYGRNISTKSRHVASFLRALNAFPFPKIDSIDSRLYSEYTRSLVYHKYCTAVSLSIEAQVFSVDASKPRGSVGVDETILPASPEFSRTRQEERVAA